ncbi:ABC transporter substrate-binding protein [Saccharopolyspora sp. K220]|uniref:ABC transporter substrate-binding protein n=1 Tax=Saccharopolyspora soli TaxID=2926618 RepID=UPI001F57142E|nr:ABC transporter substrate-binding protein [Saccharopolyspora soli]MCI2419494.1 ABC transporter substrate-binding protein [Saccharopolyspora soli]
MPFRVRSTLKLLAALAVFLLLLPATGCADRSQAGSGEFVLRVGATSVTGTPAGSLGWGDKQGILLENLAPAGVTGIEYSFFQSGKDVVAALLSGAIDVAAVGDNPSLTARGNGADIALLALDSINGDSWLIGAQGGPTSIDGLVGKTVTAPQGTIRDRAARQLIETAGLTGKIEVKDVPTPESIAGLSSGQIDATIVTEASAVELQRRGFPVIDKTSNHGQGSVGTTVALNSFVAEHPGFLQAWQAAIGNTNRHIVNNLDAYTEWVAQTDGIAVDLVREATKANTFNTEPFPEQGLAQLRQAHDFLLADRAFPVGFDVAAWARRS